MIPLWAAEPPSYRILCGGFGISIIALHAELGEFRQEESRSNLDKMQSKLLLAAAVLTGPAAAVVRDIPPFGLGTWLSDRDEVADAVDLALRSGYNHIDAAAIYRTCRIHRVRSGGLLSIL